MVDWLIDLVFFFGGSRRDNYLTDLLASVLKFSQMCSKKKSHFPPRAREFAVEIRSGKKGLMSGTAEWNDSLEGGFFLKI